MVRKLNEFSHANLVPGITRTQFRSPRSVVKVVGLTNQRRAAGWIQFSREF